MALLNYTHLLMKNLVDKDIFHILITYVYHLGDRLVERAI